MKNMRIIVVAALVLSSVAIFALHHLKASPYTKRIVGSWVMYEGGNVAPEVLSFFADGSGRSYMLSEDFTEADQPPFRIAYHYLSDPRSFMWDIQEQELCIIFEDGADMQYILSIESGSNGWHVLSLQYDIGSGGWVSAQIVEQ